MATSKCSHCNGTGNVVLPYEGHFEVFWCGHCNGTGEEKKDGRTDRPNHRKEV